jgi:hypothetical protein
LPQFSFCEEIFLLLLLQIFILETEQEPVFRFPDPGDTVIVEELREKNIKMKMKTM